jgi:4-diphosphocytidyl-2-C-methyl-D-erythritol kinase
MIQSIVAPAKLNLCLRVRNRRSDGYHSIESVMHQVEWGDQLTISYDAAGAAHTFLEVDSPHVPAGNQNLVWQAVEELRGAVGFRGEVHVRLVKQIPVGAGLGGGSADAGTVLRMLNDLAQLGLETTELRQLGLRLGADVPFAVTGGAALAEGIGERLRPLSTRLQYPVLLVHSDQSLPTSTVYRWWDEQQAGAAADGCTAGTELCWATLRLIEAVERGVAPVAWSSLLVNDLEPVVCARLPAVTRALEHLRQCPEVLGAAMTGSGSTVFALLRSTTAAARVANILERAGYRVTLTRFLLPGERRGC